MLKEKETLLTGLIQNLIDDIKSKKYKSKEVKRSENRHWDAEHITHKPAIVRYFRARV